MTKILTIDDAKSVRMLVRKALSELPFDIAEAGDGEAGLVKQDEFEADLILLDVTMPIMDGPTMLKELRAKGDNTPVVLLTAESGSNIIGPMLGAGGVLDYIIKPFKPDGLRSKVLTALEAQGISAPSLATPSAARATAQAAQRAIQPAGRQFEDILLVDDMANVAKKFKLLLPDTTSFRSCTDRATALNIARERVYRVIVVDTDMPDVDVVDMLRDIRILQPTAALVALVMRTDSDKDVWLDRGFHNVMVKPFDGNEVAELVGAYFEALDVLDVDDNVLTPAEYTGNEDGKDGFYRRLTTACIESLDNAAAACHDQVIVNLGEVETSQRLQTMMVKIADKASTVGITIDVVGDEDMDKMLKQLLETASVGVFATLDAARNKAA